MQKKSEIDFLEYSRMVDAPGELQLFIQKTINNSANAYAPYSNFLVSSGVLLQNGQMLFGANVENSSFPAGICAERNVLSHAITNYPSEQIKLISIFAQKRNAKSNSFISPCGICRQAILEAEMRQNAVIAVMLILPEDKIIVFNSAKDLLPFAFEFLP